MAFTIKHRSTGKTIKVYKSALRDAYINAEDCTTEYPTKEYIKQ